MFVEGKIIHIRTKIICKWDISKPHPIFHEDKSHFELEYYLEIHFELLVVEEH